MKNEQFNKSASQETVIVTIITFIYLLIVNSQNVFAQDGLESFMPTDYHNFQSPEAASLGRFGEIPVSLYTGVPEIKIPITELTAGPLSLPVYLQYHSAGIKATDVASWVGLGWALNAGGVITRSIRGCNDFRFNGYFYQGDTLYEQNGFWEMTNFTDESKNLAFQFGSNTAECKDNSGGIATLARRKDLSPDVFFYNFAGQSGKFVVPPKSQTNDTVQPVTIPYSRLKIEPVISADTVKSWTITTTDGTKYIFDVVEKNVSTKNLADNTWVQTYGGTQNMSWYLSEIRANNGKNYIKFTYSEPESYFYFSRSAQWDMMKSLNEEYRVKSNQTNVEHKVRQIDSIYTESHLIVFIESEDIRKDAPHIVLMDEPASLGRSQFKLENQGVILDQIRLYARSDNGNKQLKKWDLNFGYFNNNVIDNHPELENHFIGHESDGVDLFKRLRLDEVIEMSPDGNHSKTFALEYNEASTKFKRYDKLNYEFISYGNNQEEVYVSLPPYLDVAESRYHTVSNYYNPAAYDHWGYFTGRFESSLLNIPHLNYQSVPDFYKDYGGFRVEENREPNPEKITTGILTKITYPTGGYTDFEFEPHVYRYIGSKDMQENNYGGGLRIAKFSTYDGISADSIIKQYEYEDGNGLSYGSLVEQPQYMGMYFSDGGNWSQVLHESSARPIGSTQGSTVGYEKVIVKHGESGENGKEVYHYTNGSPRVIVNTLAAAGIVNDYNSDDWSGLPSDTLLARNERYLENYLRLFPGFDSSYDNMKWGFGYRTNLDFKRGRIEKKEIYNSGDTLLQDQIYEYSTFYNHFNVSSVRGMSVQGFMYHLKNYGFDEPFYQTHPTYWIQYEHPIEWSYLSKIRTRTFKKGNDRMFNSTSVAYSRDTLDLQILSKKERNSDRKYRTTYYKYAYEEYEAMKDRNMLSQKLSTAVLDNNDSVLAQAWNIWEYQDDGYWRPTEFWQRTSGNDTSDTPDETIANRVHLVNAYDGWGNPIEVTESNGTEYKMYYGYEDEPFSQRGQYGVAGRYLTGIIKDSTGLNHKIKANYNEYGQLTHIYDVNDNATVCSYNTFGRLSGIQTPESGQTEFTYHYKDVYTDFNTDQNYIKTIVQGGTAPDQINIEYLDGIGRPVQNAQKVEDGYINIVSQYNEFGRKWKQWKPIKREVADSYMNFDNLFDTYDSNLHAFYPYQEILYESSSLKRPIKTYMMDEDVNRNYSTTEYDISSYYLLSRSTDESGNIIDEYTDGWGRKIKTIADPDNIAVTTEFNYDLLGNLIEVRHPNYFGEESNENDVTTYEYDKQNNLVTKTSPDAGTVRYAYDSMENLRYQQDQNQQNNDQVGYFTYDRLGRQLVTGIADYSGQFSTLQNISSNNGFESFEHDSSTWQNVTVYDEMTGLTDTFPFNQFSFSGALGQMQNTKGRVVASVTKIGKTGNPPYQEISNTSYSDEQHWKTADSLLLKNIVIESNGIVNIETGSQVRFDGYVEALEGTEFKIKIDKQLRSTKTLGIDKVLKGNMWQLTLFSYNADGNITEKWIYTGDNPNLTGRISYVYFANGLVKMRKVRVKVNGSNKELYHYYEYDRRGLLTNVYLSTNSTKPNNPAISYMYTPSGQVTEVKYGSTTQTFDYNIRDWITEINDWNENASNFNLAQPMAAKYEYFANGNISQSWHMNPRISEDLTDYIYSYEYSYDGLNRLEGADNRRLLNMSFWSNGPSFDIRNISYDYNGNIKELQRYDETGHVIDDLNYQFNNNRLEVINELAGESTADWDVEEVAYRYDFNGNITSISGFRDIETIVYDFRNLPTYMQKTNGTSVAYAYNQEGQRVLKETGLGQYTWYLTDGAQILAVVENGEFQYFNVVGNGIEGRRRTNDEMGSNIVNTTGEIRVEEIEQIGDLDANGPVGTRRVSGIFQNEDGIDYDWYYFELLEDGTLALDISTRNIATVNWTLFETDGPNSIAGSEIACGSSSSSIGYTRDIEAGYYRLLLWMSDEGFQNNYSLQVSGSANYGKTRYYLKRPFGVNPCSS